MNEICKSLVLQAKCNIEIFLSPEAHCVYACVRAYMCVTYLLHLFLDKEFPEINDKINKFQDEFFSSRLD